MHDDLLKWHTSCASDITNFVAEYVPNKEERDRILPIATAPFAHPLIMQVENGYQPNMPTQDLLRNSALDTLTVLYEWLDNQRLS